MPNAMPLLVEFGAVASRSDDLDEIVERAVRCMAAGLRVAKAAIMVPGPDAKLAARAWVGWEERLIARMSVDAAGHEPCAQVYRSADPTCHVFDRPKHGGEWPNILSAGGIASLMGASIVTGRRRYGVLEAGAGRTGHFNADDSAFLSTLANLLAAAFARLDQESKTGGPGDDGKGQIGAHLRSSPAMDNFSLFFESLIDQLPVGVAMLDADGTILNSNAFYRDCALAQILTDGYDDTHTVAQLAGDPAVPELALRLPDGNAVWVKLQSFAVRAPDGETAIGSCIIITDITRWKSAKPPQLNPDLPHRVRNILSVIRVIARRTAERSESIEDYAAQLESRISALARVQTGMITDPQAGIDLDALIADELLAHSIKGHQVRTTGPRVKLWSKAADTLGLAIHELTENAIKYGALAVKSGQVEITWRIDREARRLEFEWSESGVSILGAAPRRRGFGHELIERTLPYELAASTAIEFRPGGIRCWVAIPLASRAALSRFIDEVTP